MSETEKLKQAIVDMTISSVKADREAIARLQKNSGMRFSELVDHLEYVALQEEVNERSIPASPKRNRLAYGLFGATAAGLVMLPFNSNKIPAAAVLGSIAAMSYESIQRR